MATGAVVLRLVRCRAAVVQTLHRCGASLLPPVSPSRSVEHPLLSSLVTLRLRPLPFTSAAPEENLADGFHGQPEHPGMRKGDWVCPRCTFVNFKRNHQCLRCKAGVPREAYIYVQAREGDWNCPGCGFMNFARNMRCLKCQANRPDNGANPPPADRGGATFYKPPSKSFESLDWNCPACHYHNFARNSECPICKEPRPSMELKDGEWECPLCKFPNFRGKMSCFKCKHSRLSDPTAKQGDGLLSMAQKIGDDSDKEADKSLVDVIKNIRKGKMKAQKSLDYNSARNTNLFGA